MQPFLFDLDTSREPSPLEGCYASAGTRTTVFKPVAGPSPFLCRWCKLAFHPKRKDAQFCSRLCRQSAFRIRRRRLTVGNADRPLRIAYADPPYPGFAAKLYKHEPTYGGEVDHAALITSLVHGYDGWALSTSAKSLRQILPLCPEAVRVCAWVKPIGVSSRTFGLHNAWEPLIVSPARLLRPGKRDWLAAQPARSGGTLIGRKPEAFCVWLFDVLGMLPGDSLDDLFPGTGIVGRAWNELSLPCSGDESNVADRGERRQL